MKKNLKIGNIPKYPDYFITKGGNLYSKYPSKNGKKDWRLMARRIKSNGYIIASLRDIHGIKKTFSIHRLVALIYIPNPDHLPCVCHRDNDRTNNNVTNLYWGTHKENSKQMVMEGRHYVPHTKIPLEEIYNLYIDFDNGYTKKELLTKYGISYVNLAKYLNNRERYEKDYKRTKGIQG